MLARHELAHRARMKAAINKADGLIKQILTALECDGYFRIDGYWSEEKTSLWQEKLDAYYFNSSHMNSAQPGGIRWNHVEQDVPHLLEIYGCDPLIVEVVKGYMGGGKIIQDRLSVFLS